MARTRYARQAGVRIAYQLRTRPLGRRRPWLVLIQGLGFDHAGWGPVVRGLGRQLRLVLVDNRAVVDPRNARLLADRIPNARLELLPGTGHLPYWEAPERFVQTVGAFLRERRRDPRRLAVPGPGPGAT